MHCRHDCPTLHTVSPGHQEPCSSGLRLYPCHFVLLRALGICWMGSSCLICGRDGSLLHSAQLALLHLGHRISVSFSVATCPARKQHFPAVHKAQGGQETNLQQKRLHWKCHRELLGKLCLGAEPGGSSSRFSCCLLGMGTPCWTSAEFLSYDSLGGWKPFSEADQSARQAVGSLRQV